MLQQRPALRVVLLFAAGILLAEWLLLPPIWLYSIAVLLVLFSVILFWFGTWQFAGVLSLQCSVIILGLLLQTIQQSSFYSRKLEPVVADESVTLFGTVDSEPSLQEQKISYVLQIDSIIRYTEVERESRRIMILIRLVKSEHYGGEIEFGKKIDLRGILEPFPFQRNPGEFDFGKYLELNDIQGIVSVKGLSGVKIGKHTNRNTLQSWIHLIQQSLYRIIDSLHSPRHASFLKGIIFGYRAEIPLDVKQSFVDTGTIHILAVSGSNVAFVVFIFFSVFGLLRLPRKVVVCATMLGLIIYMLITGSSASVVRATVMAIVLLCGTLFERKADIYNSISVAALVLMLWNTNTLFDIGFQLSFAAVVSIVYFYPRLELLIKKIPERFEEIKAVDTVLKLFAVSLAAQLGTIPFTAYYFGRVSIISLLANIPVVPISGLNTFIGFAEIIFYFINPWIAGLYTATNDFLVWFLLGFVKQAASVSFAYLETPHLNVVIVAGYYLLVLGAFNFNHMRVRTGMLILILIIGNYLLFNFIISHVNQKLTVTIIDVGQGDAVLLEFPDKKRMLVDAGPLFKKHDAGEKIIVPFLRYKGITKLDYLLITHPHSDHLGGAGSVLKSIHVDTLILNTNSSHNRMVREIFSSAQAFHVGIGVLSEGNQIYIHPGVRVYVLYPNLDHPSEGNANNNSVILKILYGNSSILFVGDAEVMAEQKIIPRYNTFLSSDILKVGHHGSNTSSSDDLLCLVHPHTAIVSVGVHNQFRHPSPFTLNRLAKHSIEIDRTDKSGAIILETDGKRWSQKEWRRRI